MAIRLILKLINKIDRISRNCTKLEEEFKNQWF